MSFRIAWNTCSICLAAAITAMADEPSEPLIDLANRLLQRSPDAFANDALYLTIRKETTPFNFSVFSDSKYDSLVARLAFDSGDATVEQSDANKAVVTWSAGFTKFFSERFRVKVPEWWMNRTAALKHPDKRAVSWSFESGIDFVRVSDLDVQLPANTTAGIEKDEVVLTFKEQSATFARGAFSLPGLNFGRRAAIHATGSRFFLAVYQDAPLAFPISCVNTHNGKLLWKSTVTGIPRSNIQGRPRQLVDFVTSEQRLFVFGIESYGAFVEAFSLDNGKRTLRLAEVEKGSAAK